MDDPQKTASFPPRLTIDILTISAVVCLEVVESAQFLNEDNRLCSQALSRKDGFG
jgi:hypothetical protein